MKLTKLFSILTLVLGLSFCLNSCEDTTTTTEPVVTVGKLAAPTNLMATSIDNESVSIKWADTNANYVKAYEIRYDGKLVDNGPTTGATTFTVGKLAAGVHTFTVSVLSSDTTKKKNSDVATITWAPAWRFANDAKIKFYSSANTTNGSGLVLFDVDENFPYNLTVKDLNLWTLGINDKATDGSIKFGPAKSLDYTNTTGKELKNVVISKTYVEVDNLSDVYDSKALDTKEYLGSAESIDLSKITTTKKGVVFVVKETTTAGTIYAKIFLKKGNNGFFVGTDKLTRYINGEVSYQKMPDVPYAK